MSSFGSCGSDGGVGSASAAGTLSWPKPVRTSQPAGAMSTADPRMTWKSCVTSSVGRCVATHAAAPVTIGAAKLVPAPLGRYPDGSKVSGTATGMSTPGAARSIVVGRAREVGDDALLGRRRDGQDVRKARRVLRLVARAAVAGGRDDERAAAERVCDGLLLHAGELVAAEAEVDHGRPGVGSSRDALDLAAEGDLAGGAGVPRAQDGLRVDPDHADPVRGRGRDRGDGGAVEVDVADASSAC